MSVNRATLPSGVCFWPLTAALLTIAAAMSDGDEATHNTACRADLSAVALAKAEARTREGGTHRSALPPARPPWRAFS